MRIFVTVAGTSTSYTDTEVDAGASYSYRVRAVNAIGSGDYSSPITVSTLGDMTPPTITAPGDRTNEATGPRTTVSIGTATATDNMDSSPRIRNNAPASFPVGTTIVTWTATDSSGNTATDTQRIIIRDTTAPVIRLAGDHHVSLFVGSPYTDPGATATDIVDGVLTGSITTSGTVEYRLGGNIHP